MSLLLWGRLWSPVVPVKEVCESWRALGLPGNPEALQAEFLSSFHYGTPLPTVSLLLHHTLNLSGDHTREEWMRVLAWLDLEFGEIRLPPDHLAIACEALAVALQRGERVVCEELGNRYLRPWAGEAVRRLEAAGSNLTELPRRFAETLR